MMAVALPGLASAQAPSCALIQQADVLRMYRRMKLDMEDKARNVKEMKGAASQDVEAFQNEYVRLRKDFNGFLSQFSSQVDAANGSPINLCDLSRAQLSDFLRLYQDYERNFLSRYEDIIGTHEHPLIDAGFADQVQACIPRSAVVQPAQYRSQYEPELVVTTWGRL